MSNDSDYDQEENTDYSDGLKEIRNNSKVEKDEEDEEEEEEGEHEEEYDDDDDDDDDDNTNIIHQKKEAIKSPKSSKSSKSSKSNDNHKKNIVGYTSDGLTRDEYKISSSSVKELMNRAECCQNYFSQDAFVHKTQYGLEIPGINTCIHCYISFNPQTFVNCENLTHNEEECLKYYIEKFTDGHNPLKCTKSVYGSKCLLCESRLGRKPRVCKTNVDAESVETVLDGSTDKPLLVMSDILMVPNDGPEFVLKL
jgi:hypothetical protein